MGGAGGMLLEARRAAGLSAATFAARLGVSRQYMSDIEHDRRVPSVRVILAASDALGVDAGPLMEAAGRFPGAQFVVRPHDGEASFTLGCWCGIGVELDTFSATLGLHLAEFWAWHRCCWPRGVEAGAAGGRAPARR
jgi:transcriptional regulator with XRE-family HTH domain